MIYEKKNTLDKKVCDGMISWYENKVSDNNVRVFIQMFLMKIE